MFGALRRNGVVHALRVSTPRCLSTKSIPQRAQWHYPSLSMTLSKARPYHSSPVRLSEPVLAQEQVQEQVQERAQEQTQEPAQEPAQWEQKEDQPAADEPLTKFTQLAFPGLVHPRIVRNITTYKKLRHMTEVQSMTIRDTLAGQDVLAQAKTGTGKTIAFLLPVMQRILQDRDITSSNLRDKQLSPADIRGIIISPTRELAEQIATEARELARGTGLRVQTAVGGTSKKRDLYKLQEEGCHLLIGTPGRLKDVLEDPESGVDAPELSAFVLDEADRLLDDGFAPDIQQIQRLLPNPMKVDRQTLLFSATVPKEVMRMVRRTMKPDFKFINTIKEDEVPTHLTVPQKSVVLDGYQNAMPAIFELAKNYAATWEHQKRPFKAIVYFNSTKEVRIAFEVFLELLHSRASPLRAHGLNTRVCELHSRLTQQQRTKTAQFFRESRTAFLFSSDVTARGMDFPGVTHVLQVGIPRDRETYIHRLGRTGRANQTGQGWIFVHSAEVPAMKKKLAQLPVEMDTSLELAHINMRWPIEKNEPAEADILKVIKSAMENVSSSTKKDAYLAQLSSSRGNFQRMKDLADAMNDLAVYGYGFDHIPAIRYELAQRLGLMSVPELNIVGIPDEDRRSHVRVGQKPFRNYMLDRDHENERSIRQTISRHFPGQSGRRRKLQQRQSRRY